MPKMGESIIEATILKWLKKEGDSVEMDETILEIATDKVDSEIPSPVDGVISKILFPEDETVEIGKVIAHITTEGEDQEVQSSPSVEDEEPAEASSEEPKESDREPAPQPQRAEPETAVSEESLRPGAVSGESTRFYSPLVRSIAASENVSLEELEAIEGTGMKGRVTKNDILNYLETRGQAPVIKEEKAAQKTAPASKSASVDREPVKAGANEEVIEMDRMRKSGLTQEEFSKAKNQLKGSFILGMESTSGRMATMGKSELMLNRIDTQDTILNKINNISYERVMESIQQFFHPEQKASVIVGKNHGPLYSKNA